MVAPTEKHCGRCERRLHRTRCGDFGNPKLVARMSGERILCHQLPRDLLRRCPIDATPHVDFSKLFMLCLRIFVQFPAFQREIRLLSVGL